MKIKANTTRIPGTGKRFSKGGSLLQTLLFVALAYFGVTTGINWVKESQNAGISDAKAREIAYQAVVMAETAERAGVDLIVEGDIIETVERVATGAYAQGGSFHGQYFGLHGMDTRTQDRVREFLELRQGRLSMRTEENFITIIE